MKKGISSGRRKTGQRGYIPGRNDLFSPLLFFSCVFPPHLPSSYFLPSPSLFSSSSSSQHLFSSLVSLSSRLYSQVFWLCSTLASKSSFRDSGTDTNTLTHTDTEEREERYKRRDPKIRNVVRGTIFITSLMNEI